MKLGKYLAIAFLVIILLIDACLAPGAFAFFAILGIITAVLVTHHKPVMPHDDTYTDMLISAEDFFEFGKEFKQRYQQKQVVKVNIQTSERKIILPNERLAAYRDLSHIPAARRAFTNASQKSFQSEPLPSQVSFYNLVLDAPGSNTPHTEIDQVIVSPYGIFCIEYKANTGIIFGSERQKVWTQCKYNGKYKRQNPLHQNYKHVKALESLLRDHLNAPIHSYVVYTNASQVNVDSEHVFTSKTAMQARISGHTSQVYNGDEYKYIIETLAKASLNSHELLSTHINEVNTYLTANALL